MVKVDLPPAEVDLTQLFRLQNRHAIICIADHFFFPPVDHFFYHAIMSQAFIMLRAPPPYRAIGSTTAQGFLEGK